MDKIVGIPRGLYFYYNSIFYTSFFNYLNIKIVISPPTDKTIIERGNAIANDEMCLSLKTYLGHIDYLSKEVDYILIPRIDNYGKEDQTCTNFFSLYDIVNNLFSTKILNYNIDLTSNETELKGLISVGRKLNKSKKEVINAYYKAKKDEEMVLIKQRGENALKLYSPNTKILIISHPYVIHDAYCNFLILKYLESHNVEIIYSDYFDTNITNPLSKNYTKTLYWKYSKDIIGSIELVKDKIDGIIFVSTFPCGPDSLVNELVIRNIDIPVINIIIDDLDSNTGIETRLESFIDILESRKKYV